MVKKKISKKEKRRKCLLVFLAVLCSFYAIYKIGFFTYKIVSLSNTRKELTSELENLKDEESSLKVEIDKLQDPDYLARYAREKYKYSKDDEIVLSIDDTEEVINTMNNDIRTYTIGVVAGSIIFVVAIFSLVIKKKNS